MSDFVTHGGTNPVQRLIHRVSARSRSRRASLFRSIFPLTATTTVLDVGSWDCESIHRVVQGTPLQPRNVHVADIRPEPLFSGARKYGYTPVLIDESGRIPFPDHYCDVLHCSSVIEHVTVPKDTVWSMTSGSEFARLALQHQRQFAAELRRVSKHYFVRTPARYFPLESHSMLPFAGYLPRRMLIPLLGLSNRFWIKATKPDFHLLTRQQMASLFPGARIEVERLCGIPKSWMAVG